MPHSYIYSDRLSEVGASALSEALHRSRSRTFFTICGAAAAVSVLVLATVRLLQIASTPVANSPALAMIQLPALRPPPLPDIAPVEEIRLFHEVRRHQSLGSIFTEHGLPITDAQAIQQQLRSASQHQKEFKSTLDAGQQLVLEFSPDGVLEALVGSLRKDALVTVKRSAAGFVGSLELLPRAPAERVFLGEINSSFSEAAREAGASYEAVDSFVDLFSDSVSFHRDFRPGDRFSVVYQDTVLEDGTSLGEGSIIAAALEVNGKQYYAIRYVGSDGVARYFDAKGELLGETFLRYPLKFSRISSYFSQSRFHPVLKKKRPHNGVDFAAPTGTAVRAVADGTIVAAGRSGGSGIMVKLQHGERYSTAYLHLSKLAAGIREGGRVKRGQAIGAVGMTGLATGPHLHFSFYDRKQYVDPLSMKLPHVDDLHPSQRIDSSYLQRALFTLQHYQMLESHELYALNGNESKSHGVS